MSAETAYGKAQAIAVEAGKSLDALMRQALEAANKFNLDNDLFDTPEVAITYDAIEDALDDYGIAPGTLRGFVEAEGDGDTYDLDAVVKW